PRASSHDAPGPAHDAASTRSVQWTNSGGHAGTRCSESPEGETENNSRRTHPRALPTGALPASNHRGAGHRARIIGIARDGRGAGRLVVGGGNAAGVSVDSVE